MFDSLVVFLCGAERQTCTDFRNIPMLVKYVFIASNDVWMLFVLFSSCYLITWPWCSIYKEKNTGPRIDS